MDSGNTSANVSDNVGLVASSSSEDLSEDEALAVPLSSGGAPTIDSDTQDESEEIEDSDEEPERKRHKTSTSEVWNHYTKSKLKVMENGKKIVQWWAKCNLCRYEARCESNNGTKDFWKHLKSKHALKKGQQMLKVGENQEDGGTVVEPYSSFHRHVSHIMTNEEVNALLKQQYKFEWEIPAENIPKSKWVGTGEKMQGDYSDILGDVKGKLRDHWQKILSDHLDSRLKFFSLCNTYRDIMHCNKKPFYLKGSAMDSSTMDAYLMHALNHVHRTRDIIIKNDAKLREAADGDIFDDNSYLDQGFTRPKVLFLLPLKSIARRIVKRLIQLSPLSQKENAIGEFKEKFGESEDELEEPEHSSKPRDFDLLFAGDIEDHFLFGIKYTKKSVKLYSNFYSSDIIVASPLALKLKIDGGGHVKEKDFDFLSSIEIVVVDHADVISMQNWSHLHAVFEQLNHLPSKQHGANVMRIRPWYLDQHARYYRQTIFLSSYLTPEMNALFNGLCLSYEGKIKLVTAYTGVLPKIQLQVRQVYERFDASSIAKADDARFDYFCKKVYPKIHESDEVFLSTLSLTN